VFDTVGVLLKAGAGDWRLVNPYEEEETKMKRIMTELLTIVPVAVFCIGFVGYVTGRVGMLF